MLSRDDVAMICAELSGALLRIGERLSAPRIVAEPAIIAEARREVAKGPGPAITRPAPEPAAAPAAAPRPVPATLQRQDAAAGPPTQAQRVLAFAAERPHFTLIEAAEAADIPKTSASAVLSVLVREAKLGADNSYPRRFWLAGNPEPGAAAAEEPPEAEERVVGFLGPMPKPGPTLRDQLLALAAGGPFTIGRAIARLQKSTQHCYNLLGDLCREGLLVRSDYSPRFYALPGQLPSAPPVEDHDERPPAEPGKRACLRCSKRFHSEGAHNRLCGTCSSTASTMVLA